MSADEKMPKTSKEDWAPYLEKAKLLMTQLGYSRSGLAVAIGATPSWVTALFDMDDPMKPSPGRAAGLERVLGQSLASLRPDLTEKEKPQLTRTDDRAIKSLFYACKIKTLEALSYTHVDSTVRDDLRLMSRNLEVVAAKQYFAAPFAHARRTMKPIDEIAKEVDYFSKVAIFAELAFSKLDSEKECGIDFENLAGALQNVATDLGLASEWRQWAGRDETCRCKWREWGSESRPKWNVLPSVGGAMGYIQSLQKPSDSEDSLLLKGADLFGWMGLQFIAGRWLGIKAIEFNKELWPEPEEERSSSDSASDLEVAHAAYAISEILGPNWLAVEIRKVVMQYVFQTKHGFSKDEKFISSIYSPEIAEFLPQRLNQLKIFFTQNKDQEAKVYLDKGRSLRRSRHSEQRLMEDCIGKALDVINRHNKAC